MEVSAAIRRRAAVSPTRAPSISSVSLDTTIPRPGCPGVAMGSGSLQYLLASPLKVRRTPSSVIDWALQLLYSVSIWWDFSWTDFSAKLYFMVCERLLAASLLDNWLSLSSAHFHFEQPTSLRHISNDLLYRNTQTSVWLPLYHHSLNRAVTGSQSAERGSEGNHH